MRISQNETTRLGPWAARELVNVIIGMDEADDAPKRAPS